MRYQDLGRRKGHNFNYLIASEIGTASSRFGYRKIYLAFIKEDKRSMINGKKAYVSSPGVIVNTFAKKPEKKGAVYKFSQFCRENGCIKYLIKIWNGISRKRPEN